MANSGCAKIMQRSHMAHVMKTLIASAKKKSTHEIVDSFRAKAIAEKILGARKHTFAVPFTHDHLYSTQSTLSIDRSENQILSLISKDFFRCRTLTTFFISHKKGDRARGAG